MRLIKLEIENLASLDRQGGEVIDFEEGALKDSNIFSIVGPTGSGKSTLLDAICLALYNRAPRYPRKKGDKNQGIEIYGELTSTEKHRLAPTDCRNILTRGRKEGYSKLTFQANNGQLYRAEWHVKFLQVKFAPVTTALYLLRNEQGKRLEVAADWEDLPRIIGLDYEQFLRTVLIAQGSFANFLTAKENDRYELLEKLIGCEDMYAAISGTVKEQKDAAVKAYEHLNAFFTAYEKDLLTDEELEALQKEIGRLEAEERKMKEELSKTNEALSWYGTERKHLANVQQFRWQVAEAQQSLEAAQGDFQRLKWHDETLPGMEIFRDRKLAESNSRRLKGQLEELDKRILQQQDRIREGELALVRLKEAENKAWQELERQRPHINRARTLQGELELVRKAVGEKEATWKAGEDGCRKAKRELAENELLIARAQEKRKQSEAAFHQLQEEMDRQKKALEKAVLKAKEGLTEVQGRLHGVDVQVLQRTKEEANRRMNDLMNAERLVEDLARIQQQLKENGKSLQQLSAENEALEKEEKGWQVEALAKELETLQQTHTLMTSENWTLHRQGLEEGKPCPLCGSTSHPYTLQEAWIPVAGELQALIGEKRQRLEALKRRQEVVTKTLGVNHGRLQSLQQQQALLLQEREKRMREWQALAEVYRTWTADAEALKGLRPGMMKEAEEAAQRLAGYHATLAEVEKRRRVWEASEENRKRGTEEADRQTRWAEQQLTELHTHLQTEVGKTPHLQQQVAEKEEAVRQAAQEYLKAQQVVKEKEAAWRQEVGDHTPDAWEQELTRAKNEATEAVARQQDGLAQLREGLKGWHGQREATGSNWQREYDRLQEKDGALQAWITAFNEEHMHLPITLGGMEELSRATDNWEEIRRRQLALQTNLTTAQTTLTNEEKALEGHRKQKPTQPEEVMAGRKAELESWSNAALTEAKARWQRHEAAKQQMGKLFDQRQAAYQEKLEWEEITEAIGGEGKTLRKIAQCYTLRFLIEHANAEIRKFNSRYELQQVKNSLGIRVIDHDRADDVRDTTSLSGGETFIVSLGLALGLSSLSSRNISFENLFIDEGFGTLDPDTLATVIDSLAMLQSSQGKKVGVISHTDTMSERITTQIRIIKNGHSGSSHLEIYP